MTSALRCTQYVDLSDTKAVRTSTRDIQLGLRNYMMSEIDFFSDMSKYQRIFLMCFSFTDVSTGLTALAIASA